MWQRNNPPIDTELLDSTIEIFKPKSLTCEKRLQIEKGWQGIKISIIANFPSPSILTDAFADVLRRAVVRGGNEPADALSTEVSCGR